jgi:hypothetical protein
MGTRSLTVVLNELKEELCVIYRQLDGGLEEHGQELAFFLKDKILVNEIVDGEKNVNGIGNLASKLITYLEKEKGVYLCPPESRGYDEEYIYKIYPVHNHFLLEVYSDENELLFSGKPEQLIGEKV